MKTSFRSALLLALALAACGAPDAAKDASAVPPAAPAGEGATHGTQGMGGMRGGGMMERMRAHMREMRGAGGDSLRAMLPAHRQMAANVVARFNGEMRAMNMTADAAWTATVDSIRQDLVRMPEMGADELRAAMPAHEARLTRLMEMHGAMMGRMGM